MGIPEDLIPREDLGLILADMGKLSNEGREDEFVGVVEQLGTLIRKSGRAW
jgi:hypothetical protein